MSESLLASLPRFDSAPAREMADVPEFGAGGLPDLPGGMEGATGDLPDLGGMDGDFAPEPDPDVAQAEVLASLEGMLSELPAAVATLEEDIRQQATEAITALAASLFPKLSEQFLSEEIARHLPGLLAPSVQEVEVLAAPGATELLSVAIGSQADNATRYSVREDEQLLPGQIRISWKSGGFDYDFEDLLSACMQRLRPDEQKTEEQK